jgi:hypothetical protein
LVRKEFFQVSDSWLETQGFENPSCRFNKDARPLVHPWVNSVGVEILNQASDGFPDLAGGFQRGKSTDLPKAVQIRSRKNESALVNR